MRGQRIKSWEDTMRIILVDDEVEFVTTLVERLSYRGIEADWVTRPEQALAKAGKECYDLGILDMKMPKMTGITLKKLLEEKCPKMRFIFLTGHGSQDAFDEGVSETGADYYLIKPVRLEDLVSKIKMVRDAMQREGKNGSES
jgi:DNA-binding response OmpR family regulator